MRDHHRSRPLAEQQPPTPEPAAPPSPVVAYARAVGNARLGRAFAPQPVLARLIDARELDELDDEGEDEQEEVAATPAAPGVARAVGLITAAEAKAMGGGSPNKKNSGNYARIVHRLKAYEQLKRPADAAQRKTLMGEIRRYIADWRNDATKRNKHKRRDPARGTILDRLETQIDLAMQTASGQVEDPAADPAFRATHDISFPDMPAYLDFLRRAYQYTEPHFWTDPKVRFEHASRTIKIAYDPLELQELYPGFRAVSQTQRTTPDAGYKTAMDQGAQGLKDDSKQAAKDFDSSGYDAALGPEVRKRLTANLLGKTQAQAVDYLLDEEQEGFAAMILSEQHGDAFHKKFLIDNMAKLKSQGVDTVYIELIRTEYQPLVDEFLATPPLDRTPAARRMKPQLEKLAARPSNAFTFDDLLFEAKANGMRVVGIDGLKASKAPGAERAMTMNHLAKEIITADRKGREDGKYALLIGAAHSHMHPAEPGKDIPPVPGLAELLGVPAVKVDAAGVALH